MYEKQMVISKILELRLQHGYSQEFVAEQLGISLDFYRHIENVDSRDLCMNTLEKMAILYDTGIVDITGW